MSYLLDTDVAIHLRDGNSEIIAKVMALQGAVLLSIISRVELEGGVYRDPGRQIEMSLPGRRGGAGGRGALQPRRARPLPSAPALQLRPSFSECAVRRARHVEP